MVTLTPARLEVLKEMAEGRVIKEYTGQGRAGVFTVLVDPPIWALRYQGTRQRKPEKAVKYSDFEALAFDLKYIIQYYTDYPDVFYMITPAGKAVVTRADPSRVVKGFPMHCDLCRLLTMDMDAHGNPIYFCDVDHRQITERRITECETKGEYRHR